MNRQGNTGSPSSPCIESFTVVSLGCAKNQVDAEELIARLEYAGYSYRSEPADADLLIVNTCGFIRDAKEESIRETVELRGRFPEKPIIIAGCLSQRYGASLLDKLPEIQAVFGNHDLSAIIPLVASLSGDRRGVSLPDFPSYPQEPVTRKRLLGFARSAYVKIAEGCRNRCSYCAIPLIRGDLRSREIAGLRREVEDLLVKGVFEIVLIAQDLASFGLDRGSPGELIPLLEELSAVPGDFWLRLLYIHPDNFPFELLDLCGKDRRILPYFDLPFQHASARILGRMNRRGDSETYLSLIDTIRSELPNSAIRSTFLLGFPGEAEGDFRELADFIEEAELDWAGFFTYSREEGTAAFRYRGPLGDLLSRRAASRRLGALQGIQEEITKKRMDRFIGHTMDILIEEEIREEGVSIGRGYIHAPDVDGAVVVKGAFPPGTVVPCRIDARNGIDLEASPLDPFARKGNP